MPRIFAYITSTRKYDMRRNVLPVWIGVLALSVAPCIQALAQQPSSEAAVSSGPRFLLASNDRSAPLPIDVSRTAALRKRLTLDLKGASTKEALAAISAQSGIKIFYVDNLLAGAQSVRLRAEGITVAAALTDILSDLNVDVLFSRDGSATLVARSNAEAPAAVGMIVGRVTDAVNGRVIEGVQVAVQDTKLRTITADSGRYRLMNVPVGRRTVTARMIGYATQRRDVSVADGEEVTADFSLQATPTQLNDVVTTATGEQRYRELGHVVVKINADSLVKSAPIMTVAELLTSRVPGLQVSTSGGTVGGEIGLRLRGQTTLSLDPQPIVIVDGVRYKSTNTLSNAYGDVVYDERPHGIEGRSPLNDLNVNDIETLEVVKGPSASTLYGPDAANGVILITTKRGKAGKPEWHVYGHPSLRSSVPKNRLVRGYQAWGHDPATGNVFVGNCTLLQQYQYQSCIQDSITIAPVSATDPDITVLAPNRPQGQVGGSVSGGTAGLQYFVSGNYDSQLGSLQVPARTARLLQQQTGTAITSAIRTPNSQQSADIHANLSTSFGDRGTLSLTTTFSQSTQRGINVGLFSNTYTLDRVPAGYTGADSVQYLNNNSYGAAFLETSEMQARRVTGVLSGTLRPFEWLTTNASVGADIGVSTDASVSPGGTDYPGQNGFGANNQRNTNGRTVSLGATATAKPGIMSFRTSLGAQYIYTHLDGLNVTAYDLAPGSTSIGTAAGTYVQQVWTESVTLGTYGEEVVGINDRLFLTAALRVDGATSYGDAYHPRLFPKVGVSWIASDEPLLHNVPGLNELRFRFSLGSSSRSPTSGMKLGLINSDHDNLEGQNQTVYYRLNLANPNVRPERTREAEYGADATLLGNRVHMSVTAYRRRTDDQLVSFSEPQGLPAAQYINTGDATAHGFETTVTVNVIQAQSWNMDLTLNTDYQTSKLLNLGDLPQGFIGAGYAVGYPLGAIFGRRIVGVADTVGGNADGIIFNNEVIYSPTGYLGQGYPSHTYTLTPTITLLHGHLRLATLFDRQTGFLQANPYLNSACADNGMCLAALLKGTPVLDQARVVSSSPDYESGNFTRWREASATIDISERLLRLVWLKRGQVSLQARNLALWSAYTGPDPESVPGAGLLPGASYVGAIGIPNPRTWTVRFDVTP